MGDSYFGLSFMENLMLPFKSPEAIEKMFLNNPKKKKKLKNVNNLIQYKKTYLTELETDNSGQKIIDIGFRGMMDVDYGLESQLTDIGAGFHAYRRLDRAIDHNQGVSSNVYLETANYGILERYALGSESTHQRVLQVIVGECLYDGCRRQSKFLKRHIFPYNLAGICDKHHLEKERCFSSNFIMDITKLFNTHEVNGTTINFTPLHEVKIRTQREIITIPRFIKTEIQQ